MSLFVRKLPMLSEKEKDPLEIDEGVQVKQEIEELDDFEGQQSITSINNILAIKKSVIKILPLNKKSQFGKENSGLHKKTVEIKKEKPCDCMQNIEYYCNKCKKTMHYVNELKQCTVCNNQLKLQCRLCQKRYKLLRSIQPSHISSNIKKESNIVEKYVHSFTCNFETKEKKLLDDDMIEYNRKNAIAQIKNEEVLHCYKCKFSTKVKEQLNIHILKRHCQPKAEVVNSDDDIYIELLCKSCEKICRKVVYQDKVNLICRECKVPMTYQCTLCCAGYKLLKNVRYHIKLVCPYRTNNEKFYCADCPFKTETKTKLKNHIIKEHVKQECSNCYQIFENNDTFKKHELIDCPVIKSNSQSIKLKLTTHNEPTEDEKFVILQYSADELVKGITSKPPKVTKEWGNLVDYLCLECGDETNKKFARYRPWCRKCNLKYEYRCISCGKLYQNFDRIQYHVKFGCPNRMVFECPLCRFNVSKKNLLHSHIQANHTIYKCMVCFTNVEGYPALINHQMSDCHEEHPSTAEQLDKLIVMYCKHCCQIPRKTARHAAKAKCPKCTETLSHQCLRCLSFFNSQKIAFKHVKQLCKPNFCCTKCSFKTYNQGGLNMHVKYKHLNRMCPDCGVCFKDELIFQLHRNEEIRRKREKLGVVPARNPKRLKVS